MQFLCLVHHFFSITQLADSLLQDRFERTMSSEGNLQCPLHALVVILHGTLLQDGFQCVTEQADSVPGFAPTLRGI